MRKSFQYRIYPTKKQEVVLNRTLSTCRHLYNDSLEERKRQSELNKLKKSFDVFPWGKPEWMSKYDQINEMVKTKTPIQKEVYSQVLQNVIERVDRSFQNFFNGKGYPRFHGRNRYNSFTYPQHPQHGFSIKGGKLTLSKIGNIKIIQHRPIEGRIKTCTIKRDINQWYVTLSCDIDDIILPVTTKNKLGIDVGLTNLLTLSDGSKIKPPKFLRLSEKRLCREQIHLSKKKKGSNNRNKQRIRLSKIYRRIRNQRKDFAHKTSRMLVNEYDHIVFEDLQVKKMMQNHHLSKSISDASWSQLIQLTSYKAEWAGKIVELVNPAGTSQICSSCGNSVPKSLSVRTHNCPHCGLVMDRDHNAAINILNKSKSVSNICTVGTTGIQACEEQPIRDSMKQETTLLSSSSQ